MIRKLITVMALSTTLILPVAAQAQTDTETLTVYAYFAKLEANIVEAGKAVSLAMALPQNSRAVRTARQEFESDVRQFNFYIRALEKQDLIGDQENALESLRIGFEVLKDQGRGFLEAPGNGGKRFFRWWLEMDDLEEEADEVLEVIAEENGIELF